MWRRKHSSSSNPNPFPPRSSMNPSFHLPSEISPQNRFSSPANSLFTGYGFFLEGPNSHIERHVYDSVASLIKRHAGKVFERPDDTGVTHILLLNHNIPPSKLYYFPSKTSRPTRAYSDWTTMELVKEFGEDAGESDGQGKRKVLSKEWLLESVNIGQRAGQGLHTVRASYGKPPPRQQQVPGSWTVPSAAAFPGFINIGDMAAAPKSLTGLSLADGPDEVSQQNALPVASSTADDLSASGMEIDTGRGSLAESSFSAEAVQDGNQCRQAGSLSTGPYLTDDNVSRVSIMGRGNDGHRSVSSKLPSLDRSPSLGLSDQVRRRVSMPVVMTPSLPSASLGSAPAHRTLKKPRIIAPVQTVIPVEVEKPQRSTKPFESSRDDRMDLGELDLEPSFKVPAAKVRHQTQTQQRPTSVAVRGSHLSTKSGHGQSKLRIKTDPTKLPEDPSSSADPLQIFQDRMGRPTSFCVLGSGPIQKRLELLIPALAGGELSDAATASILVVIMPLEAKEVSITPAWKSMILSATNAPHRLVVAHTWVDECIDQNKWIDHGPYLLDLEGDRLVFGGAKGRQPAVQPTTAPYQRETSAASSSSASTWAMPQTPDTVSTLQEWPQMNIENAAEDVPASPIRPPRKQSSSKRSRGESAESLSIKMEQEGFGYTSLQSEFRPTTRSALASVGAGKTDIYLEKGKDIHSSQTEKIGWQPKTRPDAEDKDAYANLVDGLNAWAGTEPGGAKKLSMSRSAFLHSLDRKCPAHKSYESIYKKYEYMLKGDVPNFALINGRRKRFWAMVPVEDEDQSE